MKINSSLCKYLLIDKIRNLQECLRILKHYYKDEHSSIFYFSMYGIISKMLLVVNGGMTKITGFYFDSLINYNTIFVLGGAISLFLTFKNSNKYNN